MLGGVIRRDKRDLKMNIFLFLVVAAFWGGSFIAIQPLVEIVPPMAAASMRLGIAIVALLVLFPLLKVPMSTPREVRFKVWLTGLFAFTFPFALLFWGEQSVLPGLAGILNGTVPIFVFILGALFTPGVEAISGRKVLGLLLGIIGVIAIFYPKLGAGDSSLLGAVAILLMAVSYAVSVLLNRGLFTKHPKLHPFTNLLNQLVSAFIAILVLTLIFEGMPDVSTFNPKATVLGASIYLGVGSTTIAFICFYRLIKEWGSVRASTVTYVIPATALLLDLFINGVVPSVYSLMGVASITGGVLILNIPAKKNA
jgi:drug/metabolite transporter (DMT)-like permease